MYWVIKGRRKGVLLLLVMTWSRASFSVVVYFTSAHADSL